MPKRGIGEKGVQDILNMAVAERCKPMELVERVVQGGKNPGIKPAMKKGLKDLVEAIVAVREAASAGQPVSKLIELLIEKINYENYLKAQQDYESRWGNVQELISFSTVVAQNVAYQDGNARSIPIEEILSHTLSNQEKGGADERNDSEEEEEDEDDFEEVGIKPDPKSGRGKASASGNHPFFDKKKAGSSSKSKASTRASAKRDVIDLCDSDEEAGEKVKAEEEDQKPAPAKKARTAKQGIAFAQAGGRGRPRGWAKIISVDHAGRNTGKAR